MDTGAPQDTGQAPRASRPASLPARWEPLLYAALLACFGLAYLVVGRAPQAVRDDLFGLAQLGRPGASPALAALLVAAALAAAQRGWPEGYARGLARAEWLLFDSRWRGAAAAALVGLACFGLDNHFLNPDGLALEEKFATDVLLQGAHVTHDELWELYVHSRAWANFHAWWGWSVNLTYRVLSSAAGAVFVFLLLRLARAWQPGRPLATVAVVLAGGWVQLFFGDVENYTLTAPWLLGYCFAAFLHLERRLPLVVPAALLATATMFHLLGGFLWPSLAWLGWRALRGRRWRELATAVLAFFALIVGTLAFFDRHGLPLRRLYYGSHAMGHGGNMAQMLVDPSVAYYRQIVTLLLLLAPALTLLGPLVLFRRLPRTPFNIFLGVACAGLALLVFGWNSAIGVYNDWNLFSNAMLPPLLLVAAGLGQVPAERVRPALRLGLFGLFWAHSLAWVLANHAL